MFIIFVRLSDVGNLEQISPQGLEEKAEIHIVSDLAWPSEGELTVACTSDAAPLVRNELEGIVCKIIDESQAADLKRRFGC